MRNTLNRETAPAPELASALADGELRGDEFTRAMDVLRDDEEMRTRWHDYHLIGDVLRSGAVAPVAAHDPAFVQRLRQRLDSEPRRAQAAPASTLAAARSGANDSVWRWKLVAGLSSLAVAAVLGWQIARQDGQGPVLARPAVPPSTPATQLASGEAAVMTRDPRLDQFIAEHQQLGGASALLVPAGFLRNATFERPAR